MARVSAGWVVLWLGLTACGGNVVSESSQEPEPALPDDEAEPIGGSAPDPEPEGSFGPGTELGACQLGPVHRAGSGQSCAWVAKGRCYEEREMACNCACPRARNSQCASGFDAGPNGQVWVSCE